MNNLRSRKKINKRVDFPNIKKILFRSACFNKKTVSNEIRGENLLAAF